MVTNVKGPIKQTGLKMTTLSVELKKILRVEQNLLIERVNPFELPRHFTFDEDMTLETQGSYTHTIGQNLLQH